MYSMEFSSVSNMEQHRLPWLKDKHKLITKHWYFGLVQQYIVLSFQEYVYSLYGDSFTWYMFITQA